MFDLPWTQNLAVVMGENLAGSDQSIREYSNTLNFGISSRDMLSFPPAEVYSPKHGRSPRYLGLPWLAIPGFL